MGNCCKPPLEKEEFEVDIIPKDTVAAEKQKASTFDNEEYDEANYQPDQSSLEYYEIVDNSGMGVDNIEQQMSHSYQQQLQLQQQNEYYMEQASANSINNASHHNNRNVMMGMKLDLGRIQNDQGAVVSQSSYVEEPMMRRRQSSSESIHSNAQYSQHSQLHVSNGMSQSSSQQQIYLQQQQQQQQYDGDSSDQQNAKKQAANIRLDLERINEINEADEFNPSSLQRKQ